MPDAEAPPPADDGEPVEATPEPAEAPEADTPEAATPEPAEAPEADTPEAATPEPAEAPEADTPGPAVPEPGTPEPTVPEAGTGAPGDASDDGAAGDVDLADVAAGIAGVRDDLAEARADIEAFLPDLAAGAREETLRHGLEALAREETVAAGNARLQKALDELVRLTRRADEHVAELHAENQRLRAGELASATLPMVRDVVRLHDEVTRLADASHPEARADLELVGSRLLDTLARWGLTPFSPTVGDPLDARLHQGVGGVASADGEPGSVATVRRPGFAHDDGRTFRPAEVEVFTPPAPTPEE